ncbi:MAG: PAS domain S-box protein [Deltaproteobacteria bacterium]
MIETILFISVALQVVAAFLALRLIRITEVRAAWILMATGLVLMAVGRIIDVLPFFSVEITPEINLLNELVDVIISFVMIAGVALIAPLFYAIRQSEKALRESEERYRTLVDNVNVGVYRSSGDIEGRYLQVNPAMAKIFGYESIEDFMRISISELYSEPEGRKRFIGKIRESGYVRNEELALRKRDGTPITVSVTAAAQYDNTGKIKWIDGVTEDITERKLAESALRESEEKYRSLATTADLMYMIDRNFRYTLMNEKYLLRFRLPLEKILGRAYADFHSEETAKEFVKTAEHVFESGTPVQHEYRSERDGQYFLRTFSPVKSPDGKATIAVTVVSKNIADRKQMEEKLKESEQRLYSIIQGSPIPAFVIGKDHRVLSWNRALEELSGIRDEEVIGTTRQWRAFYSEQRPCMADLLVDQALDLIPQWYFDKYIKSSLLEDAYEATDFFPELGDDGKWLRFTAASIRDFKGNLVGAIETLEDVTDRKRTEEELIRVHKLESLGIFAGGIAHDFNNLLSVMLRNIFAAKLSLADEQQEILGEGLEIAEKVGLQAKELAHRLITFAKGGEPVRKIGSISHLLVNSVDLSLSGSNVRCIFSLPDDLCPVEMDDVQIRQVIHNLVINAREAMHRGGVITINAENMNVTASSNLPLKEGRYVKWSVKDRGVGIPKEDLQRIFDPYFTTKPTGTARGMGLGLAICYAIIKKHEGFVTVESEPGVGSTFFVYLPASPQEDSVMKCESGSADTGGGKILLIHNDEKVLHATDIVLNFLGYNAECTKNGDEAIDLYKKAFEMNQPFAAVILGLDISGGKGAKETIRELLLIDPHVIAILSSGYTDDPEVMEFSKDGFRGIITVPYDVERLKKVLNTLLG